MASFFRPTKHKGGYMKEAVEDCPYCGKQMCQGTGAAGTVLNCPSPLGGICPYGQKGFTQGEFEEHKMRFQKSRIQAA